MLKHKIVQIWLIPLLAITSVMAVMVGLIPYATGYGWEKIPLWGLLWNMWRIPDWQHAMLVPFICLFLIYLQRTRILESRIEGRNWSAAIILLGFFIYWIGMKAEMQYFGFLAVQILIAGLILWFWGTKVFYALSFAWLFFAFTWPLPFLDGVMALPLRLLMSHLSFGVLGLIGVPCVQSGTAILSAPDSAAGMALGQKFQIDIADPCSGLHSLFALMMISALAGYISLEKIWPRWLVFLAAIPVAIIGNVVRIVMLTLAAEHLGNDFAIGTEDNPSWFHMACGYAVYLVALLLMFALITLLKGDWLKGRLSPPHPRLEPSRPVTGP